MYILAGGWLGLFNYILEKGVFTIAEGASYVLEGLIVKKQPAYSKINKRLVAKPWASLPVTLKKKPLVVTLDDEQLQAVEKAHEASWKKWFAGGSWRSKGALADSLSRWHWLSWQHGENMYPKEGERGYERPADAKALEVECLGRLVEDLDDALEAEDAERDDELDGAGGAPLSQKDVALLKAGLDAAGETADGDALAALGAAATASDDDARLVAADADETGSGAMDVDATAGGLSVEDASKMKCFDLKKLGDSAWGLVAANRGGTPCKRCRGAISMK